jgi:hypothetical protein
MGELYFLGFHNLEENKEPNMKKVFVENLRVSEEIEVGVKENRQRTSNCTRFPHSMGGSFHQMDFFRNLR